MMRRAAIIFSIFLISSSLWAVTPERKLEGVTVTAGRPMKEIGMTRTVLDSVSLKSSIAHSMADVLSRHTSLYVKQYGRATESTVAFRGTSPNHTQVTWNGMRINNPMLGATDFSTIPAYFIDNASVLHGASSVAETGGGLGGLIKLGSSYKDEEGLNIRYVQGIGSFRTFDEFLKIGLRTGKWSVVTKAAYSSSPNDFSYINRDKKLNIYDDAHNIIGQYYPKEKNRSGNFADLNVMQEVYFDSQGGDRVNLSAWLYHSKRGLPLLTTDYTDGIEFSNTHRETTLRVNGVWRHHKSNWNAEASGGVMTGYTAYDYLRQRAQSAPMTPMVRSRAHNTTLYLSANADYAVGRMWYFTMSTSLYQHFVKSKDLSFIGLLQSGSTGYDKGRVEYSVTASAKCKPMERVGLSAVVREEMFGHQWAAPVPALFADYVVVPSCGLTARASVTRNHRFPSLNDMYFKPGGNPGLKPEKGWSYDAGVSVEPNIADAMTVSGKMTWFDSHISDWIMWLPTSRGYYSPLNIRLVHSYGIEGVLHASSRLPRGWVLDTNASYSWTRSVNDGAAVSDADLSVGRQLPYVPVSSMAVTCRAEWRGWALTYLWNHYSRRYTMTYSDSNSRGHLPPYFMNNVQIERNLHFRPVDVNMKLCVNNLFNEHYLTVLSRPMPGINFEFFVTLTILR